MPDNIETNPSNSVLEVKLDYIQKDIMVIKQDVKEIKSDFVSRREFSETLKELKDQIKPLKQFVYGIIGVMGLAVMGAIFNLILRKLQ